MNQPDSEVNVPEDGKRKKSISLHELKTKKIVALEQERDQLRASHAELMEAAEDAYQAMAGNNDPFDPEVWSNAVLQLGQAIKNGSQVQAGNGSRV